ncbi:MAG TPA: endolytic transglycosylase MltG [Solirubrobacteraceae bacterium]
MFGKSRSSENRTADERARAAAQRAARRASRGRDGAPPPPEVFPDEDPEVEQEPAAPAANRPVMTAVQDPPAPPPPRRRPPTTRPRAPRPSRWGRRLVALIAFAAIGAALYFINAVFQPFHGSGEGAVRVHIPAGSTVARIGDILERDGVIRSSTFFGINATLTFRRDRLHPGTYVLHRDMSNGDAIEALTQGPKVRVVKTFTVTIPEGLARREVAPRIRRSPVSGDYLRASSTPAVLRRVHRLAAPRRVHTAEGFLFPATYYLYEGATAKQLVAKQLAAFAQNFRRIDMRYARSKHLTRYDVLIIASMVEREAELARERPLIAAVIYNRLKRGMPLGIDSTIRYYTNNWQRPIRVSELQSNEPYNTRLHTGLPPTPIGNPGLASLRAAAHPAHVNYLFFVRKPGKSGAHAFSSTDAQFARDNRRYQASRR